MLQERTYLFVPGIDKYIIEKAIASKADVVIIDLEDAVAENEKSIAREIVGNILGNKKDSRKIVIRINDLSTDYWEEDLNTAILGEANGIMLPKSESGLDMKRVCSIIESKSTQKEFEVIPLIETAKGVLFAYEIAQAHKLVSRIAFGSVDYSLDVGAELTANGQELLFARSSIIVASKVAGINNPIDSAYLNINDFEGFEREVLLAKQLGFKAKLLIHPKQLDIVNQILTPTVEEIKEAENIVNKFEMGLGKGLAAVSYNGELIDYPVYKKAKRLTGFI